MKSFLLTTSLYISHVLAQTTTPLHTAAKMTDYVALTNAMSTANLNAVDEDGNTALMWAAW